MPPQKVHLLVLCHGRPHHHSICERDLHHIHSPAIQHTRTPSAHNQLAIRDHSTTNNEGLVYKHEDTPISHSPLAYSNKLALGLSKDQPCSAGLQLAHAFGLDPRLATAHMQKSFRPLSHSNVEASPGLQKTVAQSCVAKIPQRRQRREMEGPVDFHRYGPAFARPDQDIHCGRPKSLVLHYSLHCMLNPHLFQNARDVVLKPAMPALTPSQRDLPGSQGWRMQLA